LITMLRCDKTTADMDQRVPDTRYAKTLDGGYIAYKILGDGEVDVAIIGSIATNIELFMDFEPAARSWFDLASSARVTLHDRRGTGLSDDMGGLPNLETRAADLQAVLDAAGQERPYLLAAGDGGMAAALFAATRPDRVAGLVWFQATARWWPATDGLMGETQPTSRSSLSRQRRGGERRRLSGRCIPAWRWTRRPAIFSQPCSAMHAAPPPLSGSSSF
jgi:pimeloyl-ACP methyl ester carboxylesterase